MGLVKVFGKSSPVHVNRLIDLGYRQIACADIILLNKIDLVTQPKVDSTEDLLHKVNPVAQVFRTIKGQIDLKHVMGIGAYTSPPPLQHKKHETIGGHNHGETEHSTHYELRGITSLQVACPVLTSTRLEKLDEWIRTVLWERHLPNGSHDIDVEVLRCKGLFTTESGEQLVLQGVRNLYEITQLDGGVVGVPDEGKIVLIGKGLGAEVRRSLELVLK
jgi:G3E family GTPase